MKCLLLFFGIIPASVTALITPLTDEKGEVDIVSLTNHVYLLEQLYNTMSTKYEAKMSDLDLQVQTLNSEIQSSSIELDSVKNNLQQTNQQISNLTSLLGKLKKPVSYEVTLTLGFFPVPDKTNLTFDNVIMNEGNGYNKNTGVFTAPLTGTYLFWTHINNADGSQNLDIHMMKNGAYVICAHSPPGVQWGIASATALFHLDQGDQVWLKKDSGSDKIYGHGLSSYGGVLLFEG